MNNSTAFSPRHPCFDGTCSAVNARIHLPVAPACNIQCNYCRRKFDCANECRPGVTSKILTPREAAERFIEAKKTIPRIAVAGIAGPGDALANAEAVLETLALIRGIDPDVLLCLSTNGLLLPAYAEKLGKAGVTHITVTLNTVKPETGRRIYRFVDFEGKRYLGEEGAALLLGNQIEGIQKAVGLGMVCKVNIVMLKGLNDSEIPGIVQKARDLGAVMTNIMQLIPVPGVLFEALPPVCDREINRIRKACEPILPQMYHCAQCRADAAGLLACERKKLGE